MSDPEQQSKPDRGRGPRSCCMGCFGGLLLCAAAGYVIYVMNNQAVRLAIPPPAPMPAVNARDDWLQAAQYARAMKHRPPSEQMPPPSGEFTFAEYAAAARDAAPVLASVRRGLGKPFRYPAMRSAASPYWRDGAAYRSVARVVRDAGDYYERAGNPDKAAEIRLDGAEMGAKVPRGGSMIPDLVGIACETIALHRFDLLVPKLSPAELARAGERLDRIAAERVPYADVLTEEGWSHTSGMVEELRKARSLKDQVEFARQMTDAAGLFDPAPSRTRRARDIARLTLANKRAMLRENLAYFQALAKEAQGPYTGKSKVPVPRNPLGESLGIFADARSRHVTAEAIVAVLRAQVALYRYRADHGRFPDALSALVPRHLKAVPDDPFGGRAGVPLRYRLLRSDCYLLYSVGPDMRDDGGAAAERFNQGPGDIVAGEIWPKRDGR